MKMKNLVYFGILLLIISACNNDPKVITAETASEPTEFNSGIFSEESNAPLFQKTTNASGFSENLHSVTVANVLPTKKYVYLEVTEAGKKFWIATAKREVNEGETYYYRDGLLKTNFESKEHNRMFDTIYLVSNLVSHNHGTNREMVNPDASDRAVEQENKIVSKKEDIAMHTEIMIEQKGVIKISELVKNASSYEGKSVTISGKVTKVNPNIMDRNWLHIKDGSKDDYDLVVTSNTFIPEGKSITIKADVVLDRDFGAGYRYDLILENGVIVE